MYGKEEPILTTKRLFAFGLAFLLIAGIAGGVLGSPGSPENPLISRSFLEGGFADTLRGDIDRNLRFGTNAAVSRLDNLQRLYAGYIFAPRFTAVTIESGGTISLSPGASFILTSGTAAVTVTRGEVINISTGSPIASGSAVPQFGRIFCAENSWAVINAASAVSGMVDGFYRLGFGGAVTPPAGSANPFADVSSADWFYNAVVHVFNAGIMQGTSISPMLFSPNMNLTRAMFVTTLYRLSGSPPQTGMSRFADVQNPESFYHAAVIWASARGIVLGFEDNTFRPNENVTREQMAAFLHRYASYAGEIMTYDSAPFNAFPDFGSVSGFAVEALRWSVYRGIISGSDGRILPQDTATRAQVAQIFLNYHNLG